MSKFKNISLIPYNKNGYSLFFVIDNIGKRDFFFDFFINNLIERRYAKNRVQLYSIAVARFLDYLIESIDYHTQKSTLIDGYKLAEIMSLFPIYLSSGEYSSNETIKSISKSLSAIPKTGSTEETYIAGVNKYLALSEDFRSRINENKEDFVGFENISTEKLFPHFDKKVALSNSEKFNITNKNMLSSVISCGRNFKRLSALKTTKRKQNDSKVLDANLNKLKNNEVTYVSFKPDAIKKDIVRGHFPSDSDAEYGLSRLEEVNNFPDLETPEIKAKISFLTTKILVASNNVRELMKEEYHGESSSLHTYSLIKSLLSSKQLTRKDLLKISNLDINAMKEQPSLFLLETKNAK